MANRPKVAAVATQPNGDLQVTLTTGETFTVRKDNETLKAFANWSLNQGNIAMKATPGAIIHGTLRPQDLLRAFAIELERLSNGAIPPIVTEARGFAELHDLYDDGEADANDIAGADEVIKNLIEYLDELAPEGHFFGAHPGDGSDFGFWPINDL